jgi:hypothetical protein
MHINKQCVLLILTISCINTAISMQDYATDEEQREIRILVGNKATYITRFARIDDHNPEHMICLGKWLSEQRKNIIETRKWNLLVKHLEKTVVVCDCHCEDNQTTIAVKKVVIETALMLKPNEDCSQLLADAARKAVHNYYHMCAVESALFSNGRGAS